VVYGGDKRSRFFVNLDSSRITVGVGRRNGGMEMIQEFVMEVSDFGVDCKGFVMILGERCGD